ncbi:uncharacterized protein LOC127727026 [Mytilus californianus]|uniref:uncharacterized protein LOC127727026 n=1 Tax=Mytilus californianus TaxID=6549 RepID=UPI00224590C7|nr:uncharacterized protein LOC127727026 [Mytilus californianus]XP_052090385.1 uncharacterized protein LOC127727026 [Mytilus californianus]
MCERFNRTLLNMLGTLQPDKKKNWKAYVGPLVHAYNCTKHESTGFAPYYLMFGRDPRLPVDVAFGIRKETGSNYIKDLRERLEFAHNLATEASKKAQLKQKKNYDTRVKGATIKKGDLVLVKIVAFEGKHKLSDKWEQDPYVVLEQPNLDIPVFTVRKENGEGRKRNLHRNLLLPVGHLVEPTKPVPKPRKRTKKEPPKPAPRICKKPTANYPESSDDEDIIDVILEPLVEDDSDSTITSDITQPVVIPTSNVDTEDDSESEGDAHSHDTIGTDSDISDRRPSQEVTSDNQEDISDSSSSSSPVSIRRSTRTKKAPAWMTSGTYELSKSASHTTTADWFQRVQCLSSLADTHLFHGKQAEAAQAIIDIISTATTHRK